MMLASLARAYLPRRPLRYAKRGLQLAARTIYKPVPRAANPYTTHVPVLIGLARILIVNRVIECGCGEYSTLTFLNRSAFPRVVKLLSLENNAEWLDRVAGKVSGDPRLEILGVNGQMSSAASAIEIDGYDLVFIDDSNSASERAATIREIAAKRAGSALIVIHDYETPEYRLAARSFKNRFTFNCLNPNTGVLWNDASINKSELRSLNKLIKRHSKQIQPSDVDGWVRAVTSR